MDPLIEALEDRDLHRQAPLHRRVDLDVEVRASGIHGRGAYARRRFAAGEYVLRQEGLTIDAEVVGDDVMAIQIGPARWLAADNEHPHPSDDVNHACDPNLGFVDGSLDMIALRPIAAGEELTFDYSTALDQLDPPIPCQCGGPGCRGVILPWSALSDEVRDALRPIALAWLRER